MGAALSFLGQKLFASSTLINAKCENISCASGAQCCTSVAAVQSPVVRRTGGFLKKSDDDLRGQAGSDSDFEVDLGESLHLQSDARLAASCPRTAAATSLGTLNWALLPEGAYTAGRLSQLQLCHRHL